MVFFNLSIQFAQQSEITRKITHWASEIAREPSKCKKATDLQAEGERIRVSESETLTSAFVPSRARD
eukprot:1588206-Lingulodinium_polyedra.AAC.1